MKGNLKDWSSAPGIKGLGRPFEYLARTDLAALPLGRTDIAGDDVFVLISEGETRPPEQVKFEAHRRYIGIQFVVRGQEAIGVAPVEAHLRDADAIVGARPAHPGGAEEDRRGGGGLHEFPAGHLLHLDRPFWSPDLPGRS